MTFSRKTVREKSPGLSRLGHTSAGPAEQGPAGVSDPLLPGRLGAQVSCGPWEPSLHTCEGMRAEKADSSLSWKQARAADPQEGSWGPWGFPEHSLGPADPPCLAWWPAWCWARGSRSGHRRLTLCSPGADGLQRAEWCPPTCLCWSPHPDTGEWDLLRRWGFLGVVRTRSSGWAPRPRARRPDAEGKGTRACGGEWPADSGRRRPSASRGEWLRPALPRGPRKGLALPHLDLGPPEPWDRTVRSSSAVSVALGFEALGHACTDHGLTVHTGFNATTRPTLAA